MPKKYLQKEQHSANRYTEPAYQEMPLQEEMPLQLDLQQTEERMSAPAAGEAVAQRMAERLPFGGEGPEPPDPPQMPPQEETAPRTKREKKLLRQRQEEQRRQEEEQARQRAEMQRREEAARLLCQEEFERQQQEDEERMEEARRKANRNILFENDHVRELLIDLVSEKDIQKAVEKAKAFIQAAGDHLFSKNEKLADAYGITADYASEIKKFNALIATQVEDQDTARQLIERAKGHKERFTQLARQRSVVSFANNGGILDLMKEECMNSDTLERILSKAAFQMSEIYDSDMSIQRAIWAEYEGVIARNVHMPVTADQINVFASGSPYRYLTKQETQEKFDQRVAELMHQDPQLSEEEAELRVYAEHKQELEEQAKERTMHSGIVPGVSAEDWARHGGASEHYTLPASQAYKIVESSKGFLYAKPVSNGLCELRPTLPETVEIGDEKIPLRRCYTLFVKAMMRGAFDDNGELKPGVEDFAGDVSYCLSSASGLQSQPLREDLKRLLGGPLEEILDGDAQQVEKTLHQIHKLMTTSSGQTFPPYEIMKAFYESIDRLKNAGDGATLSVQFDQFRKELEKRNTPPEEIEKIMAAQVNPALLKRVYRMKEAFLGENVEGPLTKEQSEEIESVYSLYADLDTAMREMMAIRNMDPDSPDVPLPNACSAHANFIAGIRKDWFGDDAPRFGYDVENHLVTHPLEHIDYCLKHPDHLGANGDSKEKILEKVGAMSQRLRTMQKQGETPVLTPEEQRYLLMLTITGEGAPSKYVYHEMANLGKTKDGMSITSEGFAAETKQYMVSPFSRKHAVGLYYGSDEYIPTARKIVNSGTVAYYNHDNPLPQEKDALLADLKQRMSQNDLPGGAI